QARWQILLNSQSDGLGSRCPVPDRGNTENTCGHRVGSIPSPRAAPRLVRGLSSRNVTTGDCFQGIMGSSSVILPSTPSHPEDGASRSGPRYLTAVRRQLHLEYPQLLQTRHPSCRRSVCALQRGQILRRCSSWLVLGGRSPTASALAVAAGS